MKLENTKSVFVMQPMYLPWLGIFKAIDLCDDFIFYNDVQFEKQSWQQRNRILNTQKGGSEFVYLKVPVEHQPLGTLISEIRIQDPRFWEQHLEQISQMYKKAPYTTEVLGVLEKVYAKKFEKLFELNIALIQTLAVYIGVAARFHQSEQLGVSGGKTERLVNFCKYLGAAAYLSAPGSKGYLDVELFQQNGIRVQFLEFEHPLYTQLKESFVSHLSVVDALCHAGPQATHDMIRNSC